MPGRSGSLERCIGMVNAMAGTQKRQPKECFKGTQLGAWLIIQSVS